MRINAKFPVALGVAALLISGCGGKPAVTISDPAGVATGTTTVSASPIPTPAKSKVSDALLTPSELGTGYAPMMASNSPATGLGSSLQGCADESPGPASSDTAQGVYQGGATGPFVAETITVSSEAQAMQRMHDLTKVIDNCAHFDGQMPGGIPLHVAIDQLTFPRIGDDTVAYRLTGTVLNAGAGIYAHLVTVRVANVVVLVALMQLTSPDVSATEVIVRAAVAKATRVLLA